MSAIVDTHLLNRSRVLPVPLSARQLREQALVESHARFVWPPRGFPGGIEPESKRLRIE